MALSAYIRRLFVTALLERGEVSGRCLQVSLDDLSEIVSQAARGTARPWPEWILKNFKIEGGGLFSATCMPAVLFRQCEWPRDEVSIFRGCRTGGLRFEGDVPGGSVAGPQHADDADEPVWDETEDQPSLRIEACEIDGPLIITGTTGDLSHIFSDGIAICDSAVSGPVRMDKLHVHRLELNRLAARTACAFSGLSIAGDVDLLGCKFAGDVSFAEAFVGKRLCVDDCRVGGDFSLTGLTLEGDEAYPASLARDWPKMRKDRNCKALPVPWPKDGASHSVMVRSVRIDGDLQIVDRYSDEGYETGTRSSLIFIDLAVGRNTLINRQPLDEAGGDGVPVNGGGCYFIRCDFAGSLAFDAMRFDASVSFIRSRVAGDLAIAVSEKSALPLLYADDTVFAEGVLVRSIDPQEHGPSYLPFAVIMERSSVGTLSIRDCECKVIRAEACTLGSGVEFHKDHVRYKVLDLTETSVQGEVRIAPHHEHVRKLELSGLRAQLLQLDLPGIEQSVYRLNLTNVVVDTYDDGEPEFLPRKLKISRLRFERYRATIHEDSLERRRKFLELSKECEGRADEATWNCFIRGYDDNGAGDTADGLYVLTRQRRRRHMPSFIRFGADWLIDRVGKYGYSLRSPVLTMIALWVIFAVIWTCADAVDRVDAAASQNGMFIMTKAELYPGIESPASAPAGYPRFHGAGLAFDYLVPFAELGVSDHWDVNTSYRHGGEPASTWTAIGVSLFVLKLVNIFAGFFMSAILFAGFARLLLRGKSSV